MKSKKSGAAKHRKSKGKGLRLAILVLAIIGIASAVIFAMLGGSNGNAAAGSAGLAAKGDMFDGVITNMRDIPNAKLGVKFSGIGVYDRNCVQVGTVPETGNPLVNCHAGIKTEDYGVLDFNHVHDYYKKPCIIEEEDLVVEILDANGNAKVQRVSEISKKAVQEGWAMKTG